MLNESHSVFKFLFMLKTQRETLKNAKMINLFFGLFNETKIEITKNLQLGLRELPEVWSKMKMIFDE